MNARNWFRRYVEHTPCAKVRLVLEFFVVFARFEYALKNAPNLPGNQNYVEPNWRQFALDDNHIKDFDAIVLKDERIGNAVEYLINNPPKVLGINNGRLVWTARQDFRYGKSSLGRAILHLKDVRNNLFHGSKNALLPEDPQGHRDEKLLKSALKVLYALVDLDPEVRRAFLHGYPER